MGNTGSIQLKEGSNVLEIEEKVIRDFQHYINVVDHSMTGLARSIDAMRTSCKLPFNSDEKTQGGQDNNKVVYDLQIVSDLLRKLDECVSDHEYVHMESLSKLFNFVLSIGKDYITSSEAEHFNFSVDKYMFQQTVVDIEDGKQYYDLRIAALQKSIEDIKGAFKISEEEVKNLNRREDLYQKEKQTLKNTVKRLETDVEKEKAEKNKAKDKNAELLLKIANLEVSQKQTVEKLQKELGAEKESKRKAEEMQRIEREEYLRAAEELKQDQILISEQTASIEELKKEIESLNTQLKNISTNLSDEKKHSKTTMEEYDHTIDGLNRNIDEMKVQVDELKGIEKENIELKQSLENEKKLKESVIEKIKEEVFSLKTENEASNIKVRKIKEENESLAEQLADKKQSIESLELQIEILKSKRIMHLQVYHQFGFSAQTGEEEMCTLLKNKIAIMSIELNIIKIVKIAHVNHSLPLLLSCTKSSSSFKKDKTVANILKDFSKVTKKMAVVIYHHKDESSFRREVESIDTEAGKDIGGIFNIGYKNMIYPCKMNDRSIDGIIDFLLEESELRYKASGETAL